MEIRELEGGDEAAFRRLNEEWIKTYFALEPKDREVLGDPRGRIVERGGFVFMAIEEGEAVGCCALLRMTDGVLELGKMAVTPKAQGRGIARRLLEAAVAAARASGAARIYLETNTRLVPAIHLYESFGFVRLDASTLPPSPYARSNLRMELVLLGSGPTSR